MTRYFIDLPEQQSVELMQAKGTILRNPEELDSALRNQDNAKFRDVMEHIARLANYGLELSDPHRDPRLDDQARDELIAFGDTVGEILEDWVRLENIEDPSTGKHRGPKHMNDNSKRIVQTVDDKQVPTSVTPSPGAMTPMHMLQIAVEQGADLDKMQKLMDLQERWELNEARKAYISAMAAFKASPPEILKTKEASFVSRRTSGTTRYSYAPLDEVSEAIAKALSKFGLRHNWTSDQSEGLIKVTCHLTHELGYGESVSLEAGPDDTGSKNNIQAIRSTITYLQRYTLLAVTGLAAKGDDDDGASADIEWISPEQVATLQSLIEEVGADERLFLKFIGAKELERIQVSAYDTAVKALERKRKQ